VDKPLCGDCYKVWAEYMNTDYREQYCHRCGEEAKITVAKPLCRPCYRASA
jgi:hypothetical protein